MVKMVDVENEKVFFVAPYDPQLIEHFKACGFTWEKFKRRWEKDFNEVDWERVVDLIISKFGFVFSENLIARLDKTGSISQSAIENTTKRAAEINKTNETPPSVGGEQGEKKYLSDIKKPLISTKNKTIKIEKDKIIILFPYDKELVEFIKSKVHARFDPTNKVWYKDIVYLKVEDITAIFDLEKSNGFVIENRNEISDIYKNKIKERQAGSVSSGFYHSNDPQTNSASFCYKKGGYIFVKFEKREDYIAEAKQAGLRWDPEERAWKISEKQIVSVNDMMSFKEFLSKIKCSADFLGEIGDKPKKDKEDFEWKL